MPETAPALQVEGLAHWFVFCRDALLVRRLKGGAVIPFTADRPVPEPDMVRKVYLGSLDGSPCYAVEVVNDRCVAPGMGFLGLRQLSGMMEEGLFQVAGRAVQVLHWDRTHRYCGRCGLMTEMKENEYARCCPGCGLVSYPRISPAVIGVVTRGNQILLARNKRFAFNFYSVIAGFVEPGETLEECLRREVREEVGIAVKNINYFGSQSWPFPHSLMVAFTSEYAGGEITVDREEIAEAGWFTADNLPNLPSPASIARRLVNWFVDQSG